MPQRCEIWAVLNVTPDSFSDGGRYLEPNAAVERAVALLEQGADVLDIGGASSRPAGRTYGDGAPEVSVDEELRRVVPVIEAVAARAGQRGARISVDTTRAQVAQAALQAGARVVNDVSNGASDSLLKAVAEAGAELVLMHNRGDGRVAGANIEYGDVVSDVLGELLAAVTRAQHFGVRRENIWLDPGVGFAKTAAHSLAVIAGLPRFVQTGHRVLLGPSRKSFIREVEAAARVERPSTASERLGGTAAAVAMGVALGAHAVRVHDLPEMRQTVLVTEALLAARSGRGIQG